MSNASDKDRFGDQLRAAERARENLYFAKIDEQLIEKIRAEQAEAKAAEKPAAAKRGDCPRCNQPLRSGAWHDLEVEFCPDCGGLWLDKNDLLDLAERGDVDLQLKER